MIVVKRRYLVSVCIAVIIGLLFFLICWDPWESQKYVLMGNDLRDLDDPSRVPGQFVGGAEITAFFKSSNAGITSGEAPFVLRVSAFGIVGMHEQVNIGRITIFDEANSPLKVYEPEASRGVLTFQQGSLGRNTWASSDFSSAVLVHDASNTRLGVELEVQVLSNSTWTAETLFFEYQLEEKSGYFDWLIIP